MKKVFKSAPLPFQGQKRQWNKKFREALKDFQHCNTFVDLFGGSGLLSHIIKSERPDAQVIYNDFDNYSKRIANIEQTNALIADIRGLIGNAGVEKTKRIPEDLKQLILSRIRLEEQLNNYVDYLTISSNILFSSNYCLNYKSLTKATLYNRMVKSEYKTDGYLDGLEITHKDYKELFNEYNGINDVCFIVDPPYLQTDNTAYGLYWKLKDFLDILNVLQGTNYVFFTSSKSSLVELCDWLSDFNKQKMLLSNTKKSEIEVNQLTTKYTDIMLWQTNN